jgi:hypothetical protein
MLRAINDFALVTKAPEISREPYWRNISIPRRNEPCPCRSGMKAKRCRHQWGTVAPEFPAAFEPELFI